MKHIILIFILSSFLSGFGQDNYQSLKNIDKLKSEIKAASVKLKSLRADFTQDKNLTFLDEIISSKGEFIFKSPNSVRWEYTKPFSYLIIIDNGSITIKDEQKENKVDIASNPIFKQINELMLSTVKGDILLNKNFTSKAFQNSKQYKLELEPKDENMKEFISSIILILDKKDMSVISIKMIEPMGDYTSILFHNKHINENIPKNSFLVR